VLNALDDFGEDEILELLQSQLIGGTGDSEAVIQVRSLDSYPTEMHADPKICAG
jgi:hypothetical protein